MNKLLNVSLTIFLTTLLLSCGPADSFEKEYFERTTNIPFPKNYSVIASADNGEYLTIVILDINEADSKKFMRDNHLKPINDSFPPNMLGLNLLDDKFKKLPDENIVYRERVYENDCSWIYCLDTLNNKLYCQINYPDMAGQ